MAVLDDPAARSAVLEALAAIGSARTGYQDDPGADAADPVLRAWAAEMDPDPSGEPAGEENLPLYALAVIAAMALDELDSAGGDSGTLLGRLYCAVTQSDTQRS